MKAKEFMSALGEVDSKYMTEAISYRKAENPHRHANIKWVLIAACLCVVMAVAAVIPALDRSSVKTPTPSVESDITGPTPDTAEPAPDTTEPAQVIPTPDTAVYTPYDDYEPITDKKLIISVPDKPDYDTVLNPLKEGLGGSPITFFEYFFDTPFNCISRPSDKTIFANIKKDEIDEICDKYDRVKLRSYHSSHGPLLWHIVYELGITRDELITYNNAKRTDAERWNANSLNTEFNDILTDVQIEMLLVMDEREAMRLMRAPYALYSDKDKRVYNFIEITSMTKEEFASHSFPREDVEQLIENIKTRNDESFIENVFTHFSIFYDNTQDENGKRLPDDVLRNQFKYELIELIRSIADLN